MPALIDLISYAGKAFFASEHGEHVEHARGGTFPGKGGPQRLCDGTKLVPAGGRKLANRGFRTSRRPVAGNTAQRRMGAAQDRLCLVAQQYCRLLVERQWALGKQEGGTVGQFHQRLGSFLEAGQGRKQLRLAGSVE